MVPWNRTDYLAEVDINCPNPTLHIKMFKPRKKILTARRCSGIQNIRVLFYRTLANEGNSKMSRTNILGASINRLRMEAHIGLREFAKRINIPANTLSQIETGGIKTPKSETIDLIVSELARILCKDKDELLIQCGTMSEEIINYFTSHPKSLVFFRKAAKEKLDESYWDRLENFDDLK
jgi:transcriptional regulator with XRE-family HTH domain